MVTDLFKVLSDPKGLGGWLRSWFPPALVANAVLFGYIWPGLPLPLRTQVSAPWRDLGLTRGNGWIISAVLLAILLQIANRSLYRILEGYLFWPGWLRTKRIESHKQQYRRLRAERDSHRNKATSGSRNGDGDVPEIAENMKKLRFVLHRLDRYPERPEWILPTKLGNTIRSFETYSYAVFRLDSQTFWNELIAVVPESARAAVGDSRLASDFLVSTYYSAMMVAIAGLVPAVVDGQWQFLLVVPAAVLVMIASYRRLVLAVDGWRYGIQALVHLGRAPLAEAMNLQLPASLEDERKMWDALTGGVQHRTDEWWILLDTFRASDDDK